MSPRLRLLNTATWDGQPLSGTRVKKLLRRMTEAGRRGSSTDALIEALWPEKLPANPHKALQIVVSRARAQLGQTSIARTEHGYRLALGADDVDMWVWEDLISAGQQALTDGDAALAVDRAQAALAIGPALRVHRILALGLARQGEHARALPIFEDLVAELPFDEELAAAYLRSLAAVQGPAAALDRFAQIQHSLADALGTDPGPELARVHRDLLALDQPVRSGVRYAGSNLLGRSTDIAQLTGLLTSSRLVSIVGPGGLGKTRLAHEVAATVTDAHVHVVELAAIRYPENLLVALADALSLQEPGGRLEREDPGRDLRSKIIRQLESGPHLVVLDNCEHLITPVATLVNELLSRVADLRILTTSRTPLRLTAERVYQLAQLTTQDAQELFRHRAQAARPDSVLPDDTVAAIVEHLDGLPLAVELAAATIRTHTADSILNNLGQRFDLLQTGDRSAPERHQTLLAVIDWSWQLLTPQAQQALMFLSLAPNSFTVRFADGVLDGATQARLDELVDQSLLSVVETDGQVRFRMLETIREFGVLKLNEAHRYDEALVSLKDWAVRTCAQAAPEILGPRQLEVVRLLRSEATNLAYVLRHLALRQDDRTATMLAALLSYWLVTGAYWNIVARLDPIERFFAGWQPTGPHRGAACQAAAVAISIWGMLPRWKQLPHTLGVLKTVRGAAPNEIVKALTNIGLTFGHQTAPVASKADLEALTASAHRYTALLARAYLAGIQGNAGEPQVATAQLEDTVANMTDQDPPWLIGLYRDVLSQLHLEAGNFRAAKHHAECAGSVLSGLDDTYQSRAIVACAQLNLGQLDAAETILQSLTASDDDAETYGTHYLLTVGQAEIALARGQTAAGLALFEQTLAELGHRIPIPGIPPGDSASPWNMLRYGIAAAAFAQYATHGHDHLRSTLLEVGFQATKPERQHCDFPVLGTVAFGLAAWGIFRGGIPRWHIIQLLALAQRVRYNRSFPSLQWTRLAQEMTDEELQHVAFVAQQLEDQSAPDILARFRDCFHAIASADTT